MAATAGIDSLWRGSSWWPRWQHPYPRPNPLAVARGLFEAAELGAWLAVAEQGRLLGVASGTVRS